MLITERVLRSLVRRILLEGVEEDAAALERRLDLGAFGPDSRKSFNDINANRKQRQKFISWLGDRYLRGTFPVTDTLADALPTVADYAAAVESINQKYSKNAVFKAAVDTAYPPVVEELEQPRRRPWNSPADIAKMDLSVFVTLLALHERKKQTHSVELDSASYQEDKVGQFGPWALYFPRTQKSSIALAGADPLTLRGYTTWCTGRAAGSNLFYNYVGHGTMLFYAIDTSAKPVPMGEPGFKPESRISLGYVNGNLVANGSHGGVTVDAKNRGLKDADLHRIFGSHYDSILSTAESVVKQHNGEHPGKAEIIGAAQDLTKFKQIIRGLSKEEAVDLIGNVFIYPISRDVAEYCASHSNDGVRKSIAHYPNTPTDVLVKLSRDAATHVRYEVATNTNTPTDVLVKLSRDADAGVRVQVVRNPNTPPDVLGQLSRDADEDVRCAVSWKPSTPTDVLEKLSRDAAISVRWAVAKNRNTPPDVLMTLSRNADVDVRWVVSANPNTPPDALEQLSRDADERLRRNVAEHPNTPSDVLMTLSRDADIAVRRKVAGNPNTPLAVLAKLGRDRSTHVKYYLKRNPTWTALPEEQRAALVAASRKAERQSQAVAESIVRTLRRI